MNDITVLNVRKVDENKFRLLKQRDKTGNNSHLFAGEDHSLIGIGGKLLVSAF